MILDRPGFPYGLTCEIAFTSPFIAPTWTDVTSRLISFRSNVGQQFDYDGPQPGTMTVVLDNTDGALDPENTSSAYYPNVKVNRQVRISVQRTSGDPLVPILHMYADSWERSWPGEMRVSETVVECTDLVKYYARWSITGLAVAANTAAVHMNAISGAATPGGGGLNVVASTYNDNQWDYITNLAIADGGLFFIAGDGTAVYQTFTYRNTATRSVNSQATFAFGLTAGTEVSEPAPRLDDRLLANMLTVLDAAGTAHNANDAASRTEYGDLPFDIDTRGPGGTGLTAASSDTRAADLRNQRANPRSRVESFTLEAHTGADQLQQALALGIGDRVTFAVQPLGGGAAVSTPYWIHGVQHDVDFRDPRWVTTFSVVGIY